VITIRHHNPEDHDLNLCRFEKFNLTIIKLESNQNVSAVEAGTIKNLGFESRQEHRSYVLVCVFTCVVLKQVEAFQWISLLSEVNPDVQDSSIRTMMLHRPGS